MSQLSHVTYQMFIPSIAQAATILTVASVTEVAVGGVIAGVFLVVNTIVTILLTRDTRREHHDRKRKEREKGNTGDNSGS